VAQRGAGGTLKIIYWQAPTILNAHQTSGQKDVDASLVILEPMAHWGPDAKPVAALAAEVPTVENGGVAKDFTSVTWKLKQGVKWSDGTDFTADDVVFTAKYMADEKTGDYGADYVSDTTVTAKDKNTVLVTYKDPNPNFYQFGVGYNALILQKAQFEPCMGEKAATCAANNAPIGTGPYKLKDFKSGDVVLYEMNDKFRDANKPFFKEIQIKGGGDATSAARAVLQTGDADYSWNVQVEASVLKPMADQSTKGELFSSAGGNVEHLNFNFSDPNKEVNGQKSEKSTKHPFLSDKIVRTALAKATDRATIGKELYGDGLTGKATCNIVAGLPYESKNTASMDICKYDIDAANKMLEDAGWKKGSDGIRAKGGVKLKITFSTSATTLRQKEQEIIKKGWTAIGADVTLKAVPGDAFFSNKSPDSTNYMLVDVSMFTNGTDPDPTSFLASNWGSQYIAQKENSFNLPNISRYSNPDYDKQVAELKKETDPAKRQDLAIKMNDFLVGEGVIVALVHRGLTNAKAKNLKGAGGNGWESELWNIGDWSNK
jgi:peptide/nickel transport system substrate-binding protein